ncbi:MAG: SIS domain-containing protein [bacterium]
MCGVVSIIYGKHNPMLGKEGASLLKKLEYRGYDSTGASFFDKEGNLNLRKKVGAPSVVVEQLEIDKLSGYKFIGQVRWATYGSVDDINAQPHEVKCFKNLIGAHNGNISNTDRLKEFLVENGHEVVSDNDGEILIHLIEHFYDASLGRKKLRSGDEIKIKAMKSAIKRAQKMVDGSYAACITVPEINGVFAIKSGSSLYAGMGTDNSGNFTVVSSDLTSVLSKTRFLIPLSEGEGLFFTPEDYVVFSLSGKKEHKPGLTRSRLNINEISLQPKYHFFMEQEIHTSPGNIFNILRYYFHDKYERNFYDIFEKHVEEAREILYSILKLYEIFDKKEMRKEFEKITSTKAFKAIYSKVETVLAKSGYLAQFTSEDESLLEEILSIDMNYQAKLYMIDHMIIWKKKRMILKYRDKLVESLRDSRKRGSHVYIVASGTSYHAGLVAGYFFNGIANIGVIPANPGAFRSQYINGLRKNDVVIAVSQSGETKDLVDILNNIRTVHGNDIKLIGLVNNENSTIPQEKTDFYLPIMCGAEIAVAATKSFTSQTALFYAIALLVDSEEKTVAKSLEKVRYYIDFTLNNLDVTVSEIALKMFLKPSIHILGSSLIGLAREGALKIREVVLNHTEGYDSAEFKHGPNTILGKNTIFSFSDMEKLHNAIFESFEDLLDIKFFEGKSRERINDYLNMVKNHKFRRFDRKITNMLSMGVRNDKKLEDAYNIYSEKLQVDQFFSNYPLIFICPPNERDKRITISQIHTHKIRGADIILIAEEDEDLKKAVYGKPIGIHAYSPSYVFVPKTGDKNLFVFEASVILQILAFKMSVNKMKYLNRNKIANHGVHPDVPKNVSKSITVD